MALSRQQSSALSKRSLVDLYISRLVRVIEGKQKNGHSQLWLQNVADYTSPLPPLSPEEMVELEVKLVKMGYVVDNHILYIRSA